MIKNLIKPRVELIESIWTPNAKLWVPHNSGEIAFAYPAFGADTYRNVGQKILSKNLQTPIGDYTASLLHSAYCSDASSEAEFENVRSIMKKNWLWVFNRNLWTDKGVYVIQDKDAVGESQHLNINDLEKALKGGKDINGIRFSKDGSVRFAPKESYNLEYNTPEKLAKDGFMIASCKKEGAEKLGEVASTFDSKPYIYGLNIREGQEPELRIFAVLGGGDWFRFDGFNGYGDGSSHALGVLK